MGHFALIAADERGSGADLRLAGDHRLGDYGVSLVLELVVAAVGQLAERELLQGLLVRPYSDGAAVDVPAHELLPTREPLPGGLHGTVVVPVQVLVNLKVVFWWKECKRRGRVLPIK